MSSPAIKPLVGTVEMSVVVTNPAAADRGCSLLDKLPAEVRLNIYHLLFEGSLVRAKLAKTAASASNEPQTVVLRHSGHATGIFLTCRRIYNEAMDVYWSKAVLRLEYPKARNGMPSEIGADGASRFRAHSYTRQLCTCLPGAVMSNVRHVRGLALPAQDSAFVRKNPSWTASAILGHFPRLKTCEMTPTLYHVRVDGHSSDWGETRFTCFTMDGGKGPAHWLNHHYGVDATTTRVDYLFEDIKRIGFRVTKRQFLNLSNGVAFVDGTAAVDIEDGYMKVAGVRL